MVWPGSCSWPKVLEWKGYNGLRCGSPPFSELWLATFRSDSNTTQRLHLNQLDWYLTIEQFSIEFSGTQGSDLVAHHGSIRTRKWQNTVIPDIAFTFFISSMIFAQKNLCQTLNSCLGLSLLCVQRFSFIGRIFFQEQEFAYRQVGCRSAPDCRRTIRTT